MEILKAEMERKRKELEEKNLLVSGEVNCKLSQPTVFEPYWWLQLTFLL